MLLVSQIIFLEKLNKVKPGLSLMKTTSSLAVGILLRPV